MRHLFRFLLNERIRSDDPAAILSGPKRGRGLPKVLSIADVDRLLVRAKELSTAPDASALKQLRGMRLSGLKSLFVILGAAGAGKSSFLRAGLIPRLQREDRRYAVLGILRPQRNPLTGDHGLAAAIHAALSMGFGLLFALVSRRLPPA